MTGPRLFAAFALLVLARAAAPAGDGAANGFFSPAEKPLAVLRVPSPDAVESFLASLPAAEAGIGPGQDWSIRPPGFPRLPGIRVFFASLAGAGAGDFWFCLPDMTRSVMGWRLPVSDPGQAVKAARDMLAAQGVDIAGIVIAAEPLADGGAMVLAAGDGRAVEAIRQGPAASGSRADSVWRSGLDGFMARTGDGVGAWLDPRPLSGMTAMFFGIDPRARLASAGLDLPSSLSLWIDISHGVPGFSLRLDGLYRPGFLAARIDSLSSLPAPPGIDWRRLAPESAKLGIWLDADGEPRWTLRGALRPGLPARDSIRRLGMWLELLASGPDAGFTVTPGDASPSSAALTMAFSGISLLAGVEQSENGGETVFLTNAGGGLPRLEQAGPVPALEAVWDIVPGAGTGKEIVALLSRLNLPLSPGFWAALVGDGEQGRLTLNNGNLFLESPRGAVAWIVPAAAMRLESLARAFRFDDSALAAARLRFLLEAAWQSRYRSADRGAPGSLPASLEQIVPADADGESWLDNALPAFPGAGRPNAVPMRQIAAGSTLNGYVYHLQNDGGWFIVARPVRNSLPALRIDHGGLVAELSPEGKWQPRRASLLEFMGGL